MEPTLLLSIVAILVLLCLSAFFSGSETALTAASTARMTSYAKEGNKRASLVNQIREKKDKMIGALLLGNNLVNILASALATSVLIKIFGEAGVIYATAVMTLLVLIFAEVLPKTYAFNFADKMAMAIAPIIKVVIFLFAPITEMVTRLVHLVLKLAGVDLSTMSGSNHMEVLRGVIELHQGKEDKVNEQRAMLRSILDLADVEVEEIMTHRKNVEMIDKNEPMDHIIRDVLESPYTRLPVWEDEKDNIVGVIHAKVLVKELQAHDGRVSKLKIEDIMTSPWFVPETTRLYDQLQAFRERREHFAIVIDEYGSYLGVVTLEDILEEIVGEIDDEHDEIVQGVTKQPNGTYLVDGVVTIRDINRAFDWELPDDEYSTIAGLILHEAQMIPDVGQVFNFYDFRFEVVRRQRNQITMIRLTPPLSDEKKEIVSL
jgi:Mg2+/Co2+ transporter CorB